MKLLSFFTMKRQKRGAELVEVVALFDGGFEGFVED
jgi:hypothetical protein